MVKITLAGTSDGVLLASLVRVASEEDIVLHEKLREEEIIKEDAVAYAEIVKELEDKKTSLDKRLLSDICGGCNEVIPFTTQKKRDIDGTILCAECAETYAHYLL
jgi:formylmethanofuran dehydrogenase subunit E